MLKPMHVEKERDFLQEDPRCRSCPIRLHRRELRKQGVTFNGELLREYAGVSIYEYLKGDKNLPPVLFVGEAPGNYEEMQRIPFIGVAGKLLRNVIKRALSSDEILEKFKNFSGNDCNFVPVPVYFSNACKCRPVGEDGSFRTPHVKEINHCRFRLVQDLKELRPALVVALGKTAAISLNVPGASTSRFDDLRGRVFFVRFSELKCELPVFVTYHPSKIRRSKMKLAKIYYDDFKNVFSFYFDRCIKKNSLSRNQRGGFSEEIVRIQDLSERLFVLKRTEEIVNFLEKILKERPRYVSLDYETTPVPWDFFPEVVQDFYKAGIDVYNPLTDVCFVSLGVKENGCVKSFSFPLNEREALEKHLKKAEELEEFYLQNRGEIIEEVERAYREYLVTGSAYVSLYDLHRKYGFVGPVEKVNSKSFIYLLARKFEDVERLSPNEAIFFIRRYFLKKMDELVTTIKEYKRVVKKCIEEYESEFDVDYEKIKPLLRELVSSQDVCKIVMNPVFEGKISKVFLDTEMTCFVGIDVVDHLLGGVQPSLEDLRKRYLPEVEFTKKSFLKKALSSSSVLMDFAHYNAFDSLITYEIFEREEREVRRFKSVVVNDFKKNRPLSDCIYRAHRFYRKVVVPLIIDVELNGIKYDVEESLKLAIELKGRARELEKKGFSALKVYVPDVDASGLRLRKKEGKEVLYRAYEGEPIYTEKGDLSISSDALKKIRQTTEREEVKKAVTYFYSALKLEKITSTYLEKYPYYISPHTGRIHCSYRITKTATGRLAASGPNVQQVPREGIRLCPKCDVFPLSDKDSRCPLCGSELEERIFIKKLFVPEDGNVLIVADYSQMEVRLLAELSGDEKLLGAIAQGLDVHSYNASSAFGVPYERIYGNKDADPEMKRLRQIAKKITFAVVYGSTPEGIAESVGITVEDARSVIDRFLESHGKVKEYVDFCHRHVGEKKCIVTPIGRVRWFLHSSVDPETGKPRESSVCREGQNTPIQSISSDVNLVAAEVERKKNPVVKGVGLVHDNIMVEVPKEKSEEVKEELKRAMEVEVKEVLKKEFGVDLKVPLKADMGVGNNWKDATP